jgi:hypothetical protein
MMTCRDRGRSKGREFWPVWCLVGLVIASLLIGACGTTGTEPSRKSPTGVLFPALPTGTAVVPVADTATLISSAEVAVATRTLVPTVTPLATPAPPPGAANLVVVHTNDNWGETEPCG